jgi:hypothetical protein
LLPFYMVFAGLGLVIRRRAAVERWTERTRREEVASNRWRRRPEETGGRLHRSPLLDSPLRRAGAPEQAAAAPEREGVTVARSEERAP